MKKKSSIAILILCLLLVAPVVRAAMQSDNYQINWDSINAGGRDDATSANYSLLDTLGEMGTGDSGSANYNILAGYRQGGLEDPILLFSVYANNMETEVTASVFQDSASSTVTVADASDFSVDDYIGVVLDQGATQSVAVGKIINIDVNEIEVDSWSGDDLSAIDGSADYAYRMDTNSVPFGLMQFNQVHTGISFVEVSTNASDGFTVQFKEDNNLRYGDGPNDIDDVSDGTVTAGEEEYGVELVGDIAQGSGDQAITGTEQDVAVSATEAENSRTITIYKASIDESTVAGNYSHTVSYYCTATF